MKNLLLLSMTAFVLLTGCNKKYAKDLNIKISPQCNIMTELSNSYVLQCKYPDNTTCFVLKAKFWGDIDGGISCFNEIIN